MWQWLITMPGGFFSLALPPWLTQEDSNHRSLLRLGWNDFVLLDRFLTLSRWKYILKCWQPHHMLGIFIISGNSRDYMYEQFGVTSLPRCPVCGGIGFLVHWVLNVGNQTGVVDRVLGLQLDNLVQAVTWKWTWEVWRVTLVRVTMGLMVNNFGCQALAQVFQLRFVI